MLITQLDFSNLKCPSVSIVFLLDEGNNKFLSGSFLCIFVVVFEGSAYEFIVLLFVTNKNDLDKTFYFNVKLRVEYEVTRIGCLTKALFSSSSISSPLCSLPPSLTAASSLSFSRNAVLPQCPPPSSITLTRNYTHNPAPPQRALSCTLDRQQQENFLGLLPWRLSGVPAARSRLSLLSPK